MCRTVRRAGTADAVSEAEGVERRTGRSGPVRRRDRPAKRAALVTMEIYSQVSSKATREALRRLGDSLDQ